MTSENIMDLGHEAIKTGLIIALPLLLTALITGLVISLFQAATQINEMTLSFIPKIIMMIIVGVIVGPDLLSVAVNYIKTLYGNIPYMIG